MVKSGLHRLYWPCTHLNHTSAVLKYAQCLHHRNSCHKRYPLGASLCLLFVCFVFLLLLLFKLQVCNILELLQLTPTNHESVSIRVCLHECKASNEIIEIGALSCISKINVSTMNARQKIIILIRKVVICPQFFFFTFLLIETRHFFCDLKMERRVCCTADIPFSLLSVKLTVLQQAQCYSTPGLPGESVCLKLTKHHQSVVWISFLV